MQLPGRPQAAPRWGICSARSTARRRRGRWSSSRTAVARTASTSRAGRVAAVELDGAEPVARRDPATAARGSTTTSCAAPCCARWRRGASRRGARAEFHVSPVRRRRRAPRAARAAPAPRWSRSPTRACASASPCAPARRAARWPARSARVPAGRRRARGSHPGTPPPKPSDDSGPGTSSARARRGRRRNPPRLPSPRPRAPPRPPPPRQRARAPRPGRQVRPSRRRLPGAGGLRREKQEDQKLRSQNFFSKKIPSDL